jgi:hypothetical protein
MLVHNPECTNGGAHAYSACRDRYNRPLKMLEVPDSAENLPSTVETVDPKVKADLEALKVAFGGLVADLGAHDPQANPGDAVDAAQRAADPS